MKRETVIVLDFGGQIGEKLPPFMLPNRFCPIKRMPLTKNGKIDRKRLLEEGRKTGR